VPEGPLREELYVESGGNPFYLEQLARTTSSDAPPAEGLADVPDQVRRALASELAELADEARLVLDAAAVAGEPFGADFVAELAGVERTAVLDAIDAALGAGLLRRSETPGWFGFRHPIVRRAVYSSIGERARAETHARAADLLAGQGATALVRAHHVECSAAVGDGAGLAVLTEAGWQSSALAPAAAAHWFDAALRLLPPGADAGQRMGLLAPLAMSLTASGRLADGLERLHELLALVPPEQELVRAKAVTAMALIERLVGEGSEARAMLRGALDSLADPRSAEAAALQLELASDRYFSADWAGMAEWAAGACALAREVGDASLLAAAAAVLGLAELSVGDPANARSLLAEAEGLIDGAADAELATHLGAAHWVGWLEHHLEHFPDVVRHYERGLALSRSTGQSHLLVPIMLGLAISRTWLGALPHAAEDADAAVEAAHLIGAPALLAITSSLRCWVAVRGGGLHEAMRAAETHVRAVTPSEVPQELLAAAWFGEALMESGSPGPGREEILRAGGGPELALLEPSQRPYYFEVLVRAELALGNLDAAHRWADETRALAERLGLVGARTWASRGAAECALAGGDSAAAAGLAQAAVETAGEVHPVERERSRIVYGRALAALGETDDAIRELEEARMQLASWSADRLAELAARELRKLGRRVGKAGTRAQGKDGLSALSARELEVARLVTDRLTNREIAERLVLSQKTVERHMDHIFRKLGVSSRVDVARAVEASETRV
jgi:DNA-binding CsgD family transcriptional regulator